MITVRLHTALKNRSENRDGILQIGYAEGLSVKAILDHLDLGHGEVGLVLVNGKIAREDFQVARGDVVELHPIFGGG